MVARGVTIAVTPLVLLFLIFQVFLLKLPVRQVAEILKGTLIAAVGLFLFLSIVRKGWVDTVLEASMKAGAHGGTVLFGRGIGRNEQQRVFGIQIEPEKEVVLTVVPAHIAPAVLDAITKAAELFLPGHGLAFIIAVEQIAGIVHLVEEMPNSG